MKTNTKIYPDVSDILERKAAGRADLRGRSFAEKLDALDALRDRTGPLRAASALREEQHPAPQVAVAVRPRVRPRLQRLPTPGRNDLPRWVRDAYVQPRVMNP